MSWLRLVIVAGFVDFNGFVFAISSQYLAPIAIGAVPTNDLIGMPD